MPCEKSCKRDKNEILVNNTVFSYSLEETGEYTCDLVVTPCNVPTSVYCVARITRRENCCNNMTYFQSFINADPVEIIQDCSLEDIIERSIEIYFDNISTFNNGNSCGCLKVKKKLKKLLHN